MFKHLYYCVIQYVQLNELGGKKRRLLNKLDSDLIWQITMFKKKNVFTLVLLFELNFSRLKKINKNIKRGISLQIYLD